MSQALSDLRMMLAHPDTLRDWFAGMAMHELDWEESPDFDLYAAECYRIADAMMEARKPRSATEAGIDGGRAEH